MLTKNFGTKGWNYLRMNEINDVFAPYNKITYTTVGFFGCLGRKQVHINRHSRKIIIELIGSPIKKAPTN
jgi:hypothetical protein